MLQKTVELAAVSALLSQVAVQFRARRAEKDAAELAAEDAALAADRSALAAASAGGRSRPIRLRDIRPARWACPVAARVQPPMQVAKVALQVLPVGRPRHPVHPRRRLGANRPVGRPQPVEINVMQQRGEPRFLIPYRYLPHTIQPVWHAVPSPVSGTCRAGPCSPWLAPFPPPPPRPQSCSAGSQVLRSDPTSRARSSQDYRLGVAWTARPLIRRTGGRGTSRFSCMKVPRMHRFSDRAGSADDSR
jgi:hypothetical protein